MRKEAVFEYERERVVQRHGMRAVLHLERVLPVLDCAAARHAKEISKELFAHAEREYFPVAAAELEQLIGAGRGYAFSAHRLQFTTRLTRVGTGICMRLSLLYTVRDEVRLAQSAESFWTADGAYRCRRVPLLRKKKKAVEK